MELTREIYWNVGRGAAVLVPMYLLTLVAIGVMVAGFLQRVKVYKIGKALQRTDNLSSRIAEMGKAVFLQTLVLRVRGPGTAHALFFWGFLLLFLGTCLIFLQADFTDLLFGVQFLKGTFYLWFSLILDLAGLVCLIMLAGLLLRRYLLRRHQLDSQPDDAMMHGLLFGILLSGFVIEAARMAVTELGSPLASWSPVGLVFARAMSGLSEATLLSLHLYVWWFHLLLVMAFIVLIPATKLRHIFTTSLNILFADKGPSGKLVSLDMDNDEAESFGAAKVADLTWKDIFDADACTLCQRCQERCPAHNTQKPLSPMEIVKTVGRLAFADAQGDLIEACDKEALWSCTTCLACQESCPALIEHVGKIVEMRRHLVLMEGEFPGEEVMAAMEQTEVNGNPLGIGFASRGDWAEDLGVKPLAEDADVDILYFVGCYASFDRRNIKIARAFIQLCQAAGIKVGILGRQEKCCGEPMRKIGNEYLYQSLAAENVALMKGYGVKQVVTSCPHCFNSLAKDYRDMDFDIPVQSYTVFLERLVSEGRLKFNAAELDCTYHDSCYLGRHNDLYDAPRQLLERAGAKVFEMEKSRNEAFCCGGGGGLIMAEESLGERVNHKRVRMAAEAGVPTLVSNCPFCLSMFEDGIKGAELEGRLEPKDLAEVLLDRLEQEPAVHPG